MASHYCSCFVIPNLNSMKYKFSSILAAVLLAVFAISSSVSDASAQARPSPHGSILSVEPLGLLGIGDQFKHLQLQYEWRTTQENSWALRAILVPSSFNYNGFGVGASYRFYIANSRALTGLNVSPGIDVYLISAGDESYTSFAVGGDVAYKWIFDNIGVEPYFRLRQLFAGNEGISAFAGTFWGFGVYLGYAW